MNKEEFQKFKEENEAKRQEVAVKYKNLIDDANAVHNEIIEAATSEEEIKGDSEALRRYLEVFKEYDRIHRETLSKIIELLGKIMKDVDINNDILMLFIHSKVYNPLRKILSENDHKCYNLDDELFKIIGRDDPEFLKKVDENQKEAAAKDNEMEKEMNRISEKLNDDYDKIIDHLNNKQE